MESIIQIYIYLYAYYIYTDSNYIIICIYTNVEITEYFNKFDDEIIVCISESSNSHDLCNRIKISIYNVKSIISSTIIHIYLLSMFMKSIILSTLINIYLLSIFINTPSQFFGKHQIVGCSVFVFSYNSQRYPFQVVELSINDVS